MNDGTQFPGLADRDRSCRAHECGSVLTQVIEGGMKK